VQLVAGLPARVGAVIADLDHEDVVVRAVPGGGEIRRVTAHVAARARFVIGLEPWRVRQRDERMVGVVMKHVDVIGAPVDVETVTGREMFVAVVGGRLELELVHRLEVVNAVKRCELAIRIVDPFCERRAGLAIGRERLVVVRDEDFDLLDELVRAVADLDAQVWKSAAGVADLDRKDRELARARDGG
jgi:hypothetical protein